MTAPSYTKLPPALSSPPPPVPNAIISFPQQHVLLVTLDRPKQLNAIPRPQHFALDRLWGWYDEEPSLRCAVITGTGRAFCAGQDLKEWNENNNKVASNTGVPLRDDTSRFVDLFSLFSFIGIPFKALLISFHIRFILDSGLPPCIRWDIG